MTRGDFSVNTIEKRLVFWALAVFVSGFLFHFAFDFFGRTPAIAPLFPMNESTWEHMKLIFWPTLFAGMAEFFLFRAKGESLAPFLVGLLTATYLIPVLFYTYTGILGYHFFLGDIGVFIAALLAGFKLWYTLEKVGYEKNQPLLIGLTVLTAAMFVVFSYYTPRLAIFQPPV